MNNETHTCVYCGQPATHQMKNGKWCCCEKRQSCPVNRERVAKAITLRHKEAKEKYGTARFDSNRRIGQKEPTKYPSCGDHVCVYCGGYAEYQLKDGRWCCKASSNSCPARRAQNAKSHQSGPGAEALRRAHENRRGKPSWNRGLTKETDDRVFHISQVKKDGYASGRLKPTWLGRHHTKEWVEQKRECMKKLYAGKSIWRTQIEKRRSYAEQYFATIFTDAQQQYHVSRYFLDFAWPDKKVYVEVDGEQHYNDPKVVAHDIERTKNLEECGWRCIARIRWSSFNRLNREQREQFVKSIQDQFHFGE